MHVNIGIVTSDAIRVSYGQAALEFRPRDPIYEILLALMKNQSLLDEARRGSGSFRVDYSETHFTVSVKVEKTTSITTPRSA